MLITTHKKVRIWNQSRYPGAEDWIKKMEFVYAIEYYSARKNKTLSLVVARISMKLHVTYVSQAHKI